MSGAKASFGQFGRFSTPKKKLAQKRVDGGCGRDAGQPPAGSRSESQLNDFGYGCT